MSGHVYVVAGDLQRLNCDAWLLPTDRSFRISSSFSAAAGIASDTTMRDMSWGGSRVVRLRPTDPALPRIWLGDVGRDGADTSWYADVIDPFVAAAMSDLGAQRGGRRPVLAVNVLGSGQGGMDAQKGAIHEALFPALYDATNEHDIDLALVCWGRRAYSAAQRVRQRHLRAGHQGPSSSLWDLGSKSEVLREEALRLGAQLRAQNLVLFIGAGVSAGAGLPMWQQLLDDIAREVPVSADELARMSHLDLRDQARLLERRVAVAGGSLHDSVVKRLTRASYSLAHAQLASLRAREAVTTNYDVLYEVAVRSAGDQIAALPYEPVQPGQRWVLKLHGSIDRDGSVVLTRSDYLNLSNRYSALIGLVQAMLLTRHMLFVGYSLSDEDFHHIVHDVRLALAEAEGHHLGTVLTLFDDPLFRELWDEDLAVIAIDEELVDPQPAEVDAAARRLNIFLDLVAFSSADLDAFLLDPTYEDLLSPEEGQLAQLMAPLVSASLSDAAMWEIPAASRVAELLRDLGADSP